MMTASNEEKVDWTFMLIIFHGKSFVVLLKQLFLMTNIRDEDKKESIGIHDVFCCF